MFSVWINATSNSRNIRYIDPEYHVVLGLTNDTTISPYLREQLAGSATAGMPFLTSFTRSPDDNAPVLYAIAPLDEPREGNAGKLGFIVLDIDPSLVLYPLVESWPVPSRSAETLLVEREGDHVRYLNNLRQGNNPALSLTTPLNRTDVPGVMAILGRTGEFTGRDYRGVDVISVIQPVPDSPWYMVAEMDSDEAFSSLHSRSGLIIALIVATLVGSIVIIALFWQCRQHQHYETLYTAEAEKRQERDFSHLVLDSSPAFYVAIDREGRVVMMNRALLTALEYTAEEITGVDYLDTFVPAEDREPLRAIFKKNIDGQTTSSVNRIVSKSGKILTVEWRGNPLAPYPEKTGIFFGIGIDITERQKIEDALRQKTTDLEAAYGRMTASERRLRSFYDSGLFGVIFWNMDGTMTDANDTFLAMVGYTREDLATGKLDWGAMTPPEYRQRDEESVKELRATGRNAVPFEREYIRKDGTRLPILVAGAMLDEKRFEGVAFVLDRSALKETRDKLATEQRRYRELFENVSVGISRSTPGPDARILAANPADLRIFGAASLDELLAIPPENQYADPEDRLRFIDEMRRTGAVNGMEIRFRTVKGTPFWGRMSSRRYAADDGSVFFDNTVEDITAQKEAREELRISEERFRGVFDRSTAGNSLTSAPYGRLLRVNQAFADMLGYSIDDLQNVNWEDIMYPEDLPGSRECMRYLLAGEQANYRMEKRYYHASGRIIWADVSTSLLRDTSGKPLYLMTTILDITERKKAEQEIREQVAFTRAVLDNLPLGIAVNSVNPEVRFEYMNDNFPAFYRVTRQDLENSDAFWEAVYCEPGFREIMKKRILEDCASGDPARMHWTDIPIVREGEPTTYIEARNVPVPDRNLMISMVWDVTERKQREILIRETNEILSQAQALAHVGSWQYMPSTGVVIWSDEIFRIFGHEPGKFDLSLENIRRAVHPDDLARHDRILGTAASTGYYEPEEYRLIRPDGSVRTIAGNGTVQRNESGAIFKITGVIQDITERKRAEDQREALIRELEQKNAELERFTYTVSHDLKSPLITIRGFAGMLESDYERGDPLQLKKDVQRITQAADTMQQLLSEVLELSRIGRIVAPPEETPFGKIAKEAVSLLTGPLAERGVTVEILPDLPVVYVDHARVREVMINLIENATKYMGDQESPHIRIGVNFTEKVPVFFVQDNGIGIDPRYLDRVFNLFEKLDPGTRARELG